MQTCRVTVEVFIVILCIQHSWEPRNPILYCNVAHLLPILETVSWNTFAEFDYFGEPFRMNDVINRNTLCRVPLIIYIFSKSKRL